jgi:apolipoprotein N-acyltransferase
MNQQARTRPDQGRAMRGALAALASAALFWAAFPPLDLGWVAWFALVPLLFALDGCRRARQAFGLAYLFGVAHYMAVIPWIGATVALWSGSPAGWATWPLLSAIKGLWYGAAGVGLWLILRRRRDWAAICAGAALYTLMEWARTQGSVAMPWASLGATQYRELPVVQVAAITGGIGVAFLLAATNLGLYAAISARCPRSMALPGLMLCGTLCYGAWALLHPPAGPPVRICVMQPNIASSRELVRDPRADFLLMRRMADEAARDRPDLVVWPESGSPGEALNDSAIGDELQGMARRLGAPMLIGTNYSDGDGGDRNSAVLFHPDGNPPERYDKQSLVPFGEWIPARRLLQPFAGTFQFYERDVVSGTPQPPLDRAGRKVGVLICFESVFPLLARERAAMGAETLALLTNDGWAGPSAAPGQHLAMTVMRAVETRRPVAAAALTGVSAVIQPTGAFEALPQDRVGTLTADAATGGGITPYVRFGDWFAGLCAVLLAGYALWRRPWRYNDQ